MVPEPLQHPIQCQQLQLMYVTPNKYEVEESVVFRNGMSSTRRLPEAKSALEISTEPTPLYSNLIPRRANHRPIDLRLPRLTPTPRPPSHYHEPLYSRINRDLLSASEHRNYEDVLTEKKSRPKLRSKSRKFQRRLLTESSVPYQLPYVSTTAELPVQQVNQILLSTQSKQIVLRLQRLNTLLRRLSFVAVQELILVCRLVRFDKGQVIFNHRKHPNIHGFIVITGSILLKCSRYRSRLVMYEDCTLEEQEVVTCRYKHHKERFDVGKCTSDNTVCLQISRSEWEMVKHRLIDQYSLHQDVKHFESVFRKNFIEKMSELNRAVYQLEG